jgi:hypothetical protein
VNIFRHLKEDAGKCNKVFVYFTEKLSKEAQHVGEGLQSNSPIQKIK